MVFKEFFEIYDKTCEKEIVENVAMTSLSHFTFSHYQYLQAIHDMDEPTLSELAEYLKITKPSTTVMINKFIKEKLVMKQQSTADKRHYNIQLTEFGKKIINIELDAFLLVCKKIMKGLDESEIAMLVHLLEKGLKNAE